MQDMTGSLGADTVGSESATSAGFLPRSFAIASYSEDLCTRNDRSNFVVLPFFALRVRRKLVVLALKSIGLMVKSWARGLLSGMTPWSGAPNRDRRDSRWSSCWS